MNQASRYLLLLTSIYVIVFSSQVRAEVSVEPYMTELLDLVNQDRASEGLDPVCLNAKLLEAAKIHNDDMINNDFFSHTGSDNSAPWDRVSAVGYPWVTVGENIAWGQTSVESVHNAWMNSPGHRANILNSDFKQMGIAKGDGLIKWTQKFATPRSSSSEDNPCIESQEPPSVCEDNEDKVTIKITTDGKGDEIYWFLKQYRVATDKFFNVAKSGKGKYGDNSEYTETVCVKQNKCMKFVIKDTTSRDGLCCEFGDGKWSVELNDVRLKTRKMKNVKKQTYQWGPC